MKFKIGIYLFCLISCLPITIDKALSEEANTDICIKLPRSILCELKQSQERSRLELERRQQEIQESQKQKQEEEMKKFLLSFKDKYGYNPLLYTIKSNIFGNTLTIFSSGGWVRMTVDSESGDVYVLYTEANRNFWTGGTNWFDKKTLNLTFTLDQKACEKFSPEKMCTFSGTDKVNLGNFSKDHELVKYGTWMITYLTEDEKKTLEFRIPLNKKPERSNDEFEPQQFRKVYCNQFPTSLSCLYLESASK
ncbi:hypothetical protein [Anabaena azotica]|uniref:Uncharacterized protein n=1 Tax=Anabaena azotica FACHB-119 TaxID=947527 RepID=A0ABR8D859_9NOST|nr:hypothetical protein [Anabaena azotica]MBD2501938.1 hypothetical protein [Anabaena azotica FACHB-119]